MPIHGARRGLAAPGGPRGDGQWKNGRGQVLAHVALCLFELGSLALTDPTGKGDLHGDVDAIRRANMEDPHRKVHTGGRAVVRAAA